MPNEHRHDHAGLHVDEEKWEAWEKAKRDYEQDPEGVDTSGSGRPDDGSAHTHDVETAEQSGDDESAHESAEGSPSDDTSSEEDAAAES